MPATVSASEIPFHFESAGLPLYGVLHMPAEPAPARPVVVHVHGLGVEQITTYRAEVLSARALAAAGYAVLRYHARGHGDSAGNFADVTLDTLAEDACAAAEVARERSGARRVAWLGVRFGSLVAARARARRTDSAGLAMWEPVHRPEDYFRGQLRGLLFSQVAEGKTPSVNVEQMLDAIEREGRVDVHGYYIHRAIHASARGRTLAGELEGWTGETLLAQLQGRPRLSAPNETLIAALRSRGANVTTFCHPEELGWHFIQNPAWECPPLVAATREWLDALD